ncbi:hypothetical protein PUN28_007175 [Cardiocondyla obscurior]|uniref:Uncharacterized protein n=1 Tax=Cardiocondyla obscurior TaxID=286306 RepID=A0AAW2G253_9HYME
MICIDQKIFIAKIYVPERKKNNKTFWHSSKFALRHLERFQFRFPLRSGRGVRVPRPREVGSTGACLFADDCQNLLPRSASEIARLAVFVSSTVSSSCEKEGEREREKERKKKIERERERTRKRRRGCLSPTSRVPISRRRLLIPKEGRKEGRASRSRN